MTNCHSTTTRRVIKSKVCQEKWVKMNTAYYSLTKKRRNENPNSGDTPIPWLNLRDFWLEQAGFPIDQPVKIRVMQGCLVVTAETPTHPEPIADGPWDNPLVFLS